MDLNMQYGAQNAKKILVFKTMAAELKQGWINWLTKSIDTETIT